MEIRIFQAQTEERWYVSIPKENGRYISQQQLLLKSYLLIAEIYARAVMERESIVVDIDGFFGMMTAGQR